MLPLVTSAALLGCRMALLYLTHGFFSGVLYFLNIGGDASGIVGFMKHPPTPHAPVDGKVARVCMHLSFLGTLPALAYSMAAAAFTPTSLIRSSPGLQLMIVLQVALIVAHLVGYVQLRGVPGFAAFLFEHGAPAAKLLSVYVVFYVLAPQLEPAAVVAEGTDSLVAGVDVLVTVFLYLASAAFLLQGVLVTCAALGLVDLRKTLLAVVPQAVQAVDDFDQAAWTDTWTLFEYLNWFAGHGVGVGALYYLAASADPAGTVRRDALLILALVHSGLLSARALLCRSFEDAKDKAFVQAFYKMLYGVAAVGTIGAHLWTQYARA